MPEKDPFSVQFAPVFPEAGHVVHRPSDEDVAVHGERSPIPGQVVAARIRPSEPETLRDLRRRLRVFCPERLQPCKVPVKLDLTDERRHSDRQRARTERPG